jgi:uncharacterized protein YoxC
MIIEISLALIAVFFVVLVFYMIALLKSARASLMEANRTMSEMRLQLDDISKETRKLLHSGYQVTEDLRSKIHTMDSLFTSIGRMGEATHEVSCSVQQVSAAIVQSAKGMEQTVNANQQSIVDVIEWASMGVHLWQKWRAQRNIKANGAASNQSTKGDGENGGQ